MLFAGVHGERAIGEASSSYLHVPGTAAAIQRRLPNVRLIAILRNPVERAYSNYLHALRDGIEPIRNFERALNAEPERTRAGWWFHYQYQSQGFYGRQLREYYGLFDCAQIKVLLYEELEADAVSFMRALFQFLEVDDQFVPDISSRYNVSREVRVVMHPEWHRWLSQPGPTRRLLSRAIPCRIREGIAYRMRERDKGTPEFKPCVRRRLQTLYRADILHLQDLIQRDLTAWLQDHAPMA
jgi:hypothetical protein